MPVNKIVTADAEEAEVDYHDNGSGGKLHEGKQEELVVQNGYQDEPCHGIA